MRAEYHIIDIAGEDQSTSWRLLSSAVETFLIAGVMWRS